jgi:KDO2-lipid IV(A) lauroyltransferase
MFKYLALLFSYKTLSWLPTPAAYFIADVIGAIMYYLRPGLRRNVQRNMRQVMGPDAPARAIRAASRRVMRNAARYYADLVRTPRLDMTRLYNERINVVSGVEELREAVAAKRGVIVVSAHYGNPEVVLQSAVVLGLSPYTLTEPLKPQRLCDLVHKLRASHGQEFQPLSLLAVREAIRRLRHGGVVPLLCDRDITNSGVAMPFFGAETRMPVGAAELALRTGALVLPMFCRRTEGGRFDLFGEPAMEMVRTGNWQEDVRANTLRIVEVLERWVRQDPGQWMVLESMWEPRKETERRQPVRQSKVHGV